MDKFAGKVKPEAAVKNNSPPRQQVIVDRTLRFLKNRDDNKRLLWLVGPADVGKSAIMRTLAETPSTPEFTLGASLFFSRDGRNDGSKVIATLAQQMANKSPRYRAVIESEFSRNPTLLEEVLTAQFDKLIVEPFVKCGISPEGHKCFLILIDGLNECNDQNAQRLILDLVSSFCIKYPTAPLAWVITSRPELHITDFLSQNEVVPAYKKEEIKVDVVEPREYIGSLPTRQVSAAGITVRPIYLTVSAVKTLGFEPNGSRKLPKRSPFYNESSKFL